MPAIRPRSAGPLPGSSRTRSPSGGRRRRTAASDCTSTIRASGTPRPSTEHPEWARIDAQGKPDPNKTSVFGPYVDELLIPQLKEAMTAYDLDGAWVDGDCWAAEFDYSPAALAAWRKETGYAAAPKSAADPHWQEWKMFHRRAFENYVARWVDAVHAFNPGFQVTSNWMYTAFIPKPVEVKLDFLSGDYSPGMSVDRARYEARYLASTGHALGPPGLGVRPRQGRELEHQDPGPAHAGGGGRPDAGRRLPGLSHADPVGLHRPADHRTARRGRRFLPGPPGPQPQEPDRPPGRDSRFRDLALGDDGEALFAVRRARRPRGGAQRPARAPLFGGRPGRAPARTAARGVPARRHPRRSQTLAGIQGGGGALRRGRREPSPSWRQEPPGCSSPSSA